MMNDKYFDSCYALAFACAAGSPKNNYEL